MSTNNSHNPSMYKKCNHEQLQHRTSQITLSMGVSLKDNKIQSLFGLEKGHKNARTTHRFSTRHGRGETNEHEQEGRQQVYAFPCEGVVYRGQRGILRPTPLTPRRRA